MKGTIIASMASYVFLVVASNLGRPVGAFDEPMQYLGAMLIRWDGRVHTDFHSVYPVLNYQFTSWMFALFGETALAGRLLHSILYVLLLAALWLLYRSGGSRGLRILVMMLVAIAMTSPLPGLAAFVGSSIAFVAIAFYVYAIGADTEARRRCAFVGTGVFAGLALLSRTNFGGYVVALFVVDQVTTALRCRRAQQPFVQTLLQETATFATPVLLCIAGMALAYHNNILEVLRQSVLAPAAAGTRYPIPAYGPGGVPLERLMACVRLMLPLLPIAWLVLRSVSWKGWTGWTIFLIGLFAAELLLCTSSPTGFALVVLCVPFALALNQCTSGALCRREFVPLFAYALFLHYYGYRPDQPHHVLVAAVGVFLLPSLLGPREPSWPRAWSRTLAIAFALLLTLPGIVDTAPALVPLGSLGVRAIREGLLTGSDAARLSAARLPFSGAMATLYPSDDENQAAQFVRRRTAADEAVYVGLTDHSRPYVNYVRVAWLLGRRMGTRHFMLMSGFVDTPSSQGEMISDLQTRRVRWILLQKQMVTDEAFLRRNPPGATLLDSYIRSRYHRVAVFGSFEVHTINPGASTAAP